MSIPGRQSLTPLQQNYLDLQMAIASGVQEVRFQDRTVRYASIKDMIQASTYMYQQLMANGQGVPVVNPDGTVSINASGGSRQIRVYTEKGI